MPRPCACARPAASCDSTRRTAVGSPTRVDGAAAAGAAAGLGVFGWVGAVTTVVEPRWARVAFLLHPLDRPEPDR